MRSAARQQLILDHYGMVRTIARRMARRYPGCVDVDDLVSIGVLGLIDSADRFDAERTGTFVAYARIRVQGTIVDALRKADFVPRSVRQRARHITETRARLENDLGRVPFPEEMGKEYRMTAERFEHVERNTLAFTLISLDEPHADTEERVSDSIASEDPAPSALVEEKTIRDTVRGAIENLPERDQNVVFMRYFEDRSFRQIGERLCVTESRVSQLHSRIKRRLEESLAA